jgi:hypothetical protein
VGSGPYARTVCAAIFCFRRLRARMASVLVALFPRVIRSPVMGSAPFTLFPCVIRAPVFGRAYSVAPTLFHADLYGILRKLEGEGPKYFARRGESFLFPNAE